MKKMYQTPRTEDVNLHGEQLMIRSEAASGPYTPLNPGSGSSIGAPQRATKLYV